MKNLLFLITTTIVLGCASTRMNTVPPDLRDPEFLKYDKIIRERFDIALDLYLYDMLAWTSSDSVTQRLSQNPELKERLGAEWFIYQDSDSNYHAVYGKYYPDEDKYETVFHFLLFDDYTVKSTNTPVDSIICLQYASAISRSFSIVANYITEKNLKLNWYVLRDSLGNLNVWYLPGQLTQEYEVYGVDFQYIYDSTGKILIDSIWNENELLIVKPAIQKQVTLVNANNKYPTVDNIFSALNILRKFKQKHFMVYIVSANYLSALAFDKDKGYSWIHSKKE